MKILEKHPLAVLAVGIFGIALSSTFVKISTAPSAVTALWRLAFAVALLTPVVFGNRKIRKELLSLSKKTILQSSISGVCLAAHLALWFESLQHTTVAASTTIVCTEVIWVALGYWLFQKGRISRRAILAIAITLAGSVVIAMSDLGGGKLHLWGVLLALAAAMVESGYTLIGKQVRKKVTTTVYTYVVYCACAVTLLAVCLVQNQNPVGYGASPMLAGALLAVFSTILGHSLFSWCLKFFSPSFVSSAKLCEPVVAAVIAVFAFSEIPGILLILGGVLILSGVFYYSRIERKEETNEVSQG